MGLGVAWAEGDACAFSGAAAGVVVGVDGVELTTAFWSSFPFCAEVGPFSFCFCFFSPDFVSDFLGSFCFDGEMTEDSTGISSGWGDFAETN